MSKKLLRSVQRGLSASPPNMTAIFAKNRKFFAAAADPLRVPVRKICIWWNF